VRKKLAVVVLVALALVAVLWFLVRPRPHRINQEDCDRITEGMTLREVEEIMGITAGDYSDTREPGTRFLRVGRYIIHESEKGVGKWGCAPQTPHILRCQLI
jgi:hypothetical protein